MSFANIFLPKHWVFKAEVPNLEELAGKHVSVVDGNKKRRVVEIERCVGSLKQPHLAQIDSRGESFLISWLDLFAQINGEQVSEEDIKKFNETVFEVVSTPHAKTLNQVLRGQ